jgi:carboxylesterase
MLDAVVTMPGAEPWSAAGRGRRGEVGIVVTHGFAGNPRSTRPLGQRLAAAGYSVEVPLLPGHGTHPRDLGTTRYRDWIGHLERVVEHLAGRCAYVVLIGHAVGGTLSLDLASRRGDQVAAVVTINAPLSVPRTVLARAAPLLQFAVPYVPRRLAGMPADDIARSDVEEGAYPVVATRAARSLSRELPRIRSQLLDLTQPLLVVHSTVDHTVTPNDATELMELAGAADIRELICERSYHVVLLDHDAPLVEDAVRDFLEDVTGR